MDSYMTKYGGTFDRPDSMPWHVASSESPPLREGRYLDNRDMMLKCLFRKIFFVIEIPDPGILESPQRSLIRGCASLQDAVRTFYADSKTVSIVSPVNQIHTFILIRTGSEFPVSRTLDLLQHQLTSEGIHGEYIYADKLPGDTDDRLQTILRKHFHSTQYYTGGEPLQKPRSTPKQVKGRFHLDFTAAELLAYMKRRIRGQDRAVEQGIMFVMEYLHAAASGEGIRDRALSWFLTAPSGMGKTEFYRALHDFLQEHHVPVPVVQIDLSQITETGYKGNNVDYITDQILAEKKLGDGTAICFLDEADKKFMPSYSAYGVNCSELVQNNLLTVIEGSVLESRDGEKCIDTNKTMFVLMGAFQSIRSRKRREAEQYERLRKAKDSQESDHAFYTDITVEDMIGEGMLEELAGRITAVVNMDRIPEDVMRMLLADKAVQIAGEFGISIELTETALDALVGIAYTNLGVRAPVSRLRREVIRKLSEEYFKEGYESRRTKVIFTSLEHVAVVQQENPAADPSAEVWQYRRRRRRGTDQN